MNSRERQLRALARKSTDRISTDCIDVMNSERIAQFQQIPEDEVDDLLGIDGRIVIAEKYSGEIPGYAPGLNEWGTDADKNYSVNNHYPLLEDPENFRMPDPDLYNYEEAAERARAFAGRYAVRGPYWLPLFSRICSLYGMEETMVKMVAEPEEFEKVTEMVFEYQYRYCENFLNTLGDSLDILCLADDFASQTGMMFSPELWRKYFKERWRKLFALGKKHGKYIWFHSCGNITAVLPDLIEVGADVWETVQLHTLPITPQQLKAEYGKDITFFGGVNSQALPFWTPQQTADEVKRVIDALYCDGEGLILGPDHQIDEIVPPENALALFETARTYKMM